VQPCRASGRRYEKCMQLRRVMLVPVVFEHLPTRWLIYRNATSERFPLWGRNFPMNSYCSTRRFQAFSTVAAAYRKWSSAAILGGHNGRNLLTGGGQQCSIEKTRLPLLEPLWKTASATVDMRYTGPASDSQNESIE